LQTQSKGGTGSTFTSKRRIQHEWQQIFLAADSNALGDSGPPTPESEDRTFSLLASGPQGKTDARRGLHADDQSSKICMNSASLISRPSPMQACENGPGSASSILSGRQRMHVLYTGLFFDHNEQQKLFERYFVASPSQDECYSY